jgi:hypothetical protein
LGETCFYGLKVDALRGFLGGCSAGTSRLDKKITFHQIPHFNSKSKKCHSPIFLPKLPIPAQLLFKKPSNTLISIPKDNPSAFRHIN